MRARFTTTTRHITVAVVGAVVLATMALTLVHAQLSGVTQELIGAGRLAFSDVTGGPADVGVARIRIDPGSSYGGWHIHPGLTWVVVNSGEAALYGPDGCRTAYAAGTAYVAEPNTPYDLRNEGTTPLEVAVAGVIPAGQPATIFIDPPEVKCGAAGGGARIARSGMGRGA